MQSGTFEGSLWVYMQNGKVVLYSNEGGKSWNEYNTSFDDQLMQEVLKITCLTSAPLSHLLLSLTSPSSPWLRPEERKVAGNPRLPFPK